MTEITQADRDAADEWKWFLYDREDYDPEKQMEKNVADLTADFARHRMEERAAIVAYIRREQLDDYNERTAKETEAWWYANAIEAGEHLK